MFGVVFLNPDGLDYMPYVRHSYSRAGILESHTLAEAYRALPRVIMARKLKTTN